MRCTALWSKNGGKKPQKTAQTAATDMQYHRLFGRSDIVFYTLAQAKTLEGDFAVSDPPTIR